MRNNGVNDAKKDQAFGVEDMGETYKKGGGIDGHHKESVKKKPGKMSDPSNIKFMKKKDHIEYHKNQKSDKA